MGEVLETRVASIVPLTWVEVENFFSTLTRKAAQSSINNANFYFVITVYFADYGWDFFWEATGLHQRNLCIVRLIENLFSNCFSKYFCLTQVTKCLVIYVSVYYLLSAQDVFKLIKAPKHKNKDLLISASYFEIYGSKVSCCLLHTQTSDSLITH